MTRSEKDKDKTRNKRINVRNMKYDVKARSKKGFFRVVFSRTTILVLLLLLQVGLLLVTFNRLTEYMLLFFGGYTAISIIVIIFIMNQNDNPIFKLSWIIPIAIAPIPGTLLYLFIRIQPGSKLINTKIKQLSKETIKYLNQELDVKIQLRKENEQEADLSHYIRNYAGYPTYINTSAKFFPLGEDKFEELVYQLEKAEKFIFLEYFIIEEGLMWDTVLEVLKRKAKDGVEVRLLYDGTCAFKLLPFHYPEKMQAYGIRCKMYAPIWPMLSTHYNNRDHRKVVVIDGHTAFTGGINLADEYINKKVRFGHWKDTGIMVQGDAVTSFTVMFLQMWDISERESSDYNKYMVKSENMPSCGSSKGYVIPYADSPMDEERVGEQVYLDILYSAKRYVHIMTPYLILDYEITQAITFAAKRGVEVIIMMPHIPDKVYAFWLSRTHYKELLDAGVKIYEYTPGFVHGKEFISDDEKAVVGTINLDYRSLYLHFECAAYFYRHDVIKDVEADFQETLKKCQQIDYEDLRRSKWYVKFCGILLKLIEPLM